MAEIKATAKNVWLPMGVVGALLLAAMGITANYVETRSTAYSADDRSISNAQKYDSLSPVIATLTAQVTVLNANLDEIKKKN